MQSELLHYCHGKTTGCPAISAESPAGTVQTRSKCPTEPSASRLHIISNHHTAELVEMRLILEPAPCVLTARLRVRCLIASMERCSIRVTGQNRGPTKSPLSSCRRIHSLPSQEYRTSAVRHARPTCSAGTLIPRCKVAIRSQDAFIAT